MEIVVIDILKASLREERREVEVRSSLLASQLCRKRIHRQLKEVLKI